MNLIGVATTIGPAQAEAVWQKDGLAVTRAVLHADLARGQYVVTHLPSGHGLWWFPSKAAAIRAAKALLAAGDWNRPYDEVRLDWDMKRAFLEVVEAQS